jgi:hypothetical protein
MRGNYSCAWTVTVAFMFMHLTVGHAEAEPTFQWEGLDPCNYKDVIVGEGCPDRREASGDPLYTNSKDKKDEIEEMKEDRAFYKCYLSQIGQVRTEHGSKLVEDMCFEYPQAIDW